LNRYLAESGAPVRTLADLMAWNRNNAARAMPIFGQELFERAEAKGPLTDAAYVTARNTARRLALGALTGALETSSLDALIAPSMSPAWPTDHVLGDHFVGAGYGIAAVAGTPSITVPAGATRGLPLGVTFMGPAYREKALLGYAYALEQRLKARIPPDFSEGIE
jgi:amidase